MLVTLNQHCINLLRLFGETELVNEYENVAEWLQLAASIKSIKVDIIQFDAGFGMCSHADEYVMSRELLLNEFVIALTKYNYVWCGLEAMLNTLKIPKSLDKAQRGKIQAACHFLQKHFEYRDLPQFFVEETQQYKNNAKLCFGYDSIEKRFKKAEKVGIAGSGLLSVYELRNLFAHGSLAFPEPDEENQPESNHSKMLEHATRIVLLSIQMLLLAYTEESKSLIYYDWSELDGDEYPLFMILRGCHVLREEEINQLNLI